MASDIITCLNLDKQSRTGTVIVTKEINGCDSSFITSCILAHTVKNKSPTLLVLLHNSLNHYQNVGLKMFYNINKSIDTNLICVYDVIEDVENIVVNVVDVNLLLNILERIDTFRKANGCINVVVDGLSHLFDLGYTVKDLNTFCRSIVSKVRESNSFVLFNCNVASEEDVTEMFCNVLSHQADTVVVVESLASGLSADVSGHLKITHTNKRFEEKFMFNMDIKSSHYLFKLFDRGVKLLAPGTV